MAAYNKFNAFVENQWVSKIDWDADTFKLMATNVAPVATNSVKGDLTEISAGNGYTAGGPTVTITASRTGGTETVQGAAVTIAASGGAIAAFQYLALYDDTVSSPSKPLVCWFDYGSALTLNSGDSLIVTFNGTNPGTIHTVT